MEHLPKAPIQEALLDISVSLPPSFDVAALKAFTTGLETRFPTVQERVALVQGIQFAPGGFLQSSNTTRSVSGYLFISKTDAKVVQGRLDGFTFNKLRPYSKWPDFKTEAFELWNRYREVAKPECVKRLGLRYINRIELPPDLVDLRDFCLLFPDIPKKIPQQLSEFFQKFSAPREDGSIAAVTLSIDNGNPQQKAAIILDIDVSWVLPDKSPEDDTIWAQFDTLRSLKNEIFDASLTEKAKSLFR